ncbi:MAG: zinc-dependent dehydrogenase [Candidatus Omnitrophota bacterium]
MKVAMYYNNRDVRIEEMPKPGIGPGELLIKVLASGICGSDVLEWYRIKKAPLVLGHEIAGTIDEVGDGVDRFKVGDRVFVSHHIPCNSCYYCLNDHHTACETLHTTNYFPGGFSEYIRVPKLNVEIGTFILPDRLSFEEGSFIEPLACCVRGQKNAALREGQSVLILGSGISGLLHLLLARSQGSERIVVTDVNDYRLKIAKRLGADLALNAALDIPAHFKEVNDGRLADLVIICTGALSAFTQGLQSVDRGGTVLFFASPKPGANIPVPVDQFWRNEIKLMPSYGNSPEDASRAIELMRTGLVDVKRLISHRLGLDEAARGFRLVAEARDSLKVILQPHKA